MSIFKKWLRKNVGEEKNPKKKVKKNFLKITSGGTGQMFDIIVFNSKKTDNTKFKPDSLMYIQSSLERFLSRKQYIYVA